MNKGMNIKEKLVLLMLWQDKLPDLLEYIFKISKLKSKKDQISLSTRQLQATLQLDGGMLALTLEALEYIYETKLLLLKKKREIKNRLEDLEEKKLDLKIEKGSNFNKDSPSHGKRSKLVRRYSQITWSIMWLNKQWQLLENLEDKLVQLLVAINVYVKDHRLGWRIHCYAYAGALREKLEKNHGIKLDSYGEYRNVNYWHHTLGQLARKRRELSKAKIVLGEDAGNYEVMVRYLLWSILRETEKTDYVARERELFTTLAEHINQEQQAREKLLESYYQIYQEESFSIARGIRNSVSGLESANGMTIAKLVTTGIKVEEKKMKRLSEILFAYHRNLGLYISKENSLAKVVKNIHDIIGDVAEEIKVESKEIKEPLLERSEVQRYWQKHPQPEYYQAIQLLEELEGNFTYDGQEEFESALMELSQRLEFLANDVDFLDMEGKSATMKICSYLKFGRVLRLMQYLEERYPGYVVELLEEHNGDEEVKILFLRHKYFTQLMELLTDEKTAATDEVN